MLNHQILEADNRLVHRAGSNDAQRVGDLDRKVVGLRILIGNTKQGEGRWRRLGFPLCFDSRQFGFLHVTHFVTGFVTQHNNGEDRRHTEAGCDGKGALGKGEVATFQHVPGANRQDEHRAGDIARRHSVNEFHLGDRVEHQFREADHLHTHGFEVEVRCDRVLHPAVGDEDPQRGEVGAQRNQPGDRHVLNFTQTIPTEEEQTYKGGFEEEGHQTFNGQRRTEDIAHVV